jgi:5'-deoxynucleotidase YfbR-like HD superfamily hydrolase
MNRPANDAGESLNDLRDIRFALAMKISELQREHDKIDKEIERRILERPEEYLALFES